MGAAPNIEIESLVTKLEELPTLPTIVHELNDLINDPMSSTTDIERVMEKDQSLTTKVLRLINSAYYAIPGGVSSLSRAIAYLGFDTVHQLVLSTSIFKSFKAGEDDAFDFKQFWKHSIGVAMTAETIGKFIGHPTPSDLFTAGLVHDIGKVALFSIDPDTMGLIAEHAQSNDMTIYDAEIKLDIPTHAAIGNILARQWKLPVTMIAAIQYHHRMNPKQRGGISAQLNQSVDVVILANLLIHAIRFGHSGHNLGFVPPKSLFSRLSIPADDIKKLSGNIKNCLSNAESFLKIIGES
jgi:putative nucleotidyltransferase with HDIG domain